MIEAISQYLSALFSSNPTSGVLIVVGFLFVFISILGSIEVGAFRTQTDSSGRRVLLYLGLALIAIGLTILAQPSFSFLGRLFADPVSKLHRAALQWDVRLGNEAIQELRKTKDICNHLLADYVGFYLNRDGNNAFNQINEIQNTIQQAYPQCEYPTVNYKF